jgi:hypothetical protein
VQAFASVLSPAEQRSMRDSIIQDEDVLDTWFSSALCVPVVRLPSNNSCDSSQAWRFRCLSPRFPLTTFGWPQAKNELPRFYPLDVMETGCARCLASQIILLGCHLVPMWRPVKISCSFGLLEWQWYAHIFTEAHPSRCAAPFRSPPLCPHVFSIVTSRRSGCIRLYAIHKAGRCQKALEMLLTPWM